MFKNIILSILLAIFVFNIKATKKAKLNQRLIAAIRWDALKAIYHYLDKGADVNISVTHNWTPLHYAAYYNKKDTAELLIHSGANINAQNVFKESALHLAAYNSDHLAIETIILLLRLGIDKNIRNEKYQTAADIAKTQEIKEIINNYLAIARR